MAIPETRSRIQPGTELFVWEDSFWRSGYYRVIEGPEAYHFVRVPAQLLGPGAEQLAAPIRADGTDEEIRARYRRGFAVRKADIRRVELRFENFSSRWQMFFCCGQVVLHLNSGKARAFRLLFHPDARTSCEVEAFFSAVHDRIRLDVSGEQRGTEARQKKLDRAAAVLKQLEGSQSPSVRRAVRVWAPIADILLAVLSFVILFLSLTTSISGQIWGWVLYMLALLPWAAMIFAPGYVSPIAWELPERSWLEAHGVTLVPVIYTLIAPPGFLALFRVMTLEHMTVPAVCWGAVIALVLTAATCLRTPEARRYLGSLIGIFLLSAMVGSGIAIQTNRLFDWRAPETHSVQILAQQSGELTLRDETGALHTYPMDVPDFTDWRYGQRATLISHSGALGMAWDELRVD